MSGGQSGVRSVGRWFRRSSAVFVGRLVGWSVGWSLVRLLVVRFLVGRSVGRLVGWLVFGSFYKFLEVLPFYFLPKGPKGPQFEPLGGCMGPYWNPLEPV